MPGCDVAWLRPHFYGAPAGGDAFGLELDDARGERRLIERSADRRLIRPDAVKKILDLDFNTRTRRDFHRLRWFARFIKG